MVSELDLQVLDTLEKLGGKELISKMVTLFTSHAETAIREASSALAAGNLDSVGRVAHSLKSSAANVGARQVQMLADEMEQRAEQGDRDIDPLLTDLQNAFLRAKSRLTEEMREGKQ